MTHTWVKITKAVGTKWNKNPKPSNEVSITGGDSIGLLLALTYSTTSTNVTGWKKITKPSGTAWNKITKAT